MDGVSKALISFLIIPISVSLRGFVLAKLWVWFVVSSFGLPEISIAAAIGIAAFLAMATHQQIDVEERKVPFAERMAQVLFSPLITLLFGFIIYQFI